MIKSVRYCTSNENGVEELAIVRELSTLEYLAAAAKERSFKIPTTITEEWVVSGLRWVEKSTGDFPDDDKQHELFVIKGNIVRKTRLIDAGLWKDA